jgi:hypothetical protein
MGSVIFKPVLHPCKYLFSPPRSEGVFTLLEKLAQTLAVAAREPVACEKS